MTDWDETTRTALPDSEPERPERDRAYLIVLAGFGVGEMFKVVKDEVILGRGMEADVRLMDEGVSRRHCRIVRRDTELHVQDLGSRNGTFCNGEPVTDHVLHDGDKLQIGRTTILKFTYHDQLDESFQRQMYDSALRDGLTQTYNKRYFSERLNSEFQFADRHGTPLSLLLLDIDLFKSINDEHGHLAGDHVLVQFTRHVQNTIRNEDVLARYGGEEFAIISRAIGRADAAKFAERLRKSIEDLEIRFAGHSIRVTASIGVAAIPDATITDATALIAAADHALYQAKQEGRNRTFVGADPVSHPTLA